MAVENPELYDANDCNGDFRYKYDAQKSDRTAYLATPATINLITIHKPQRVICTAAAGTDRSVEDAPQRSARPANK